MKVFLLKFPMQSTTIVALIAAKTPRGARGIAKRSTNKEMSHEAEWNKPETEEMRDLEYHGRSAKLLLHYYE